MAATASVLSCGGSTATGGSDAASDVGSSGDTGGGEPDATQGGRDAASGNDAAPDVAVATDGSGGMDVAKIDGGGSPCPTSAPMQGAACSPVGLMCEYGNAVQIGCDTVATCASGGWQVPAGQACIVTPQDAGSCPATIAQVPTGQACSPRGLTCPYATGICYCASDHTGVPQLWTCFPAAGCPYPRPRLGEPCTMDAQQCDYSICAASVLCTGGLWQQGNGGCHP